MLTSLYSLPGLLSTSQSINCSSHLISGAAFSSYASTLRVHGGCRDLGKDRLPMSSEHMTRHGLRSATSSSIVNTSRHASKPPLINSPMSVFYFCWTVGIAYASLVSPRKSAAHNRAPGPVSVIHPYDTSRGCDRSLFGPKLPSGLCQHLDLLDFREKYDMLTTPR